MRRAVVTFVLLAAAMSALQEQAWADAATQAHEAYDRGTRAYRRGDYETAAREYAAADALSTNPVALQAALDAAVLADDPVLGEELLDRAREAARTNGLALTMLTAQRKFARRTGRIHVACAGAGACIASVDGAAVDPAKPVIVRVGAHTVIVESGGTATTRDVTVGPDEVIEVAPGAGTAAAPAAATGSGAAPGTASASASASGAAAAPAAGAAAVPVAVAAGPETRHGISPVWFYVGVAATGIAGVATVVSGADTAEQHSTFVAQCGGPSAPPNCSALKADGLSAQTRTNVLIGVTAGLAVLTGVTLLFVRWHDTRVGMSLGGVTMTGRF